VETVVVEVDDAEVSVNVVTEVVVEEVLVE
jgi:hypothetical protein